MPNLYSLLRRWWEFVCVCVSWAVTTPFIHTVINCLCVSASTVWVSLGLSAWFVCVLQLSPCQKAILHQSNKIILIGETSYSNTTLTGIMLILCFLVFFFFSTLLFPVFMSVCVSPTHNGLDQREFTSYFVLTIVSVNPGSPKPFCPPIYCSS